MRPAFTAMYLSILSSLSLVSASIKTHALAKIYYWPIVTIGKSNDRIMITMDPIKKCPFSVM